MAEKKEKKYANNEKIKCPYCGRQGTVMLSHDDLSVVHSVVREEVKGRYGFNYTRVNLVDGCSRLGKMGIPNEQNDCDF